MDKVNQIHKNSGKFHYPTKEKNISGMLSKYTLIVLC